MSSMNLVLSLPQGMLTATNLGIEGYAWHRSPGSGQVFHDRKIFFDLALAGGSPQFQFLDEGGWRDAMGDTLAAMAAVSAGKRTKTALSNNAFSCTPIDAFDRGYLVKTGGHVLELEQGVELMRFGGDNGHEGMTPDDVAQAIGRPSPHSRAPRLYMVLCPVEILVMSTLTPEEYAWYATRRPGKKFRQVLFTELHADKVSEVAARSIFEEAHKELTSTPNKKTKTIVAEDVINRIIFPAWTGYSREAEGGLYTADRSHIKLWRFPARLPNAWERADG